MIDDADLDLRLPRVPAVTLGVGLLHELLLPKGAIVSRVNYQFRDEFAYTDNNFGYIQQADNRTGVITATGNVRITYPDRRMVATSRQAQYYSKEGRLVLTGDVDVIDEEGQRIRAERIVYRLDSERVVAEPQPGRPALLTHDDVTTLFHEFGHGLHHMLTQVNERDVSGISGVEWDAVELPSQFMENFCWEWDVLKHMTAHVDTGEPLPRALFEKMLAAKNFQSGLQTLRQIEFSLFDMLLHQGQAPGNDVMALLRQVRNEVSLLQPPAYHRMPHTFSHIFAGGYAAGYYSYKWAEVLDADAYGFFREAPDQAAPRFRTLLESGGTVDPMDLYVAFRGRQPQPEALLRRAGLLNPTA